MRFFEVSMSLKNVIALTVSFIFIIFSIFPAFADTVSLYSNIDDSNNVCNLLVDAMRNDAQYDPYNEYAVVRAGEFDYRIYFGKDLSGSDLVYYRYIPQSYGISASIQRGTASSLSITKNGYYYVGNTEGALASASAENYKLGAVISIAVVVILFFVLFRFFRKSEGNKAHYYKVR